MRVEAVEIHKLKMTLLEPFETSFGVESLKEFLLLKVHVDNVVGYGECVTSEAPLYSEETNETALHMLRDFFIPALLTTEFDHPQDLREIFRPYKGNPMAKAALENALWDGYSKAQGKPLHVTLGGTKQEIEVGISIGLQKSLSDLLERVEGYLDQGYRRIKVKIAPGRDLELVRMIRQSFGDIALMVDANSAYTLADLPMLRGLDEYGLMMIEQPLGHDDIFEHAKLAHLLNTPICLDESIRGVDSARAAIEMGACRIINLKVGRVGGLTESLAIEQLCRKTGVGLWCGGMLESGVGRLVNLAITSLSGFNLPGDTAPSSRYFAQDIIEPEVRFLRPGVIAVPSGIGIGAELRDDLIGELSVDSLTLSL